MDSRSDLDRYARSFERHLRAENKSPKTFATYGEAVSQLICYLRSVGISDASVITREDLDGFFARLLEDRSPATVANRFRALQQFFRWLVEEEHVETDPMTKMHAPKVTAPKVAVLTGVQVKALLGTCHGRSFEDRRDEAVIRLLADTGVRRSELLGLRRGDVFLDERLIEVLGKGSRIRQVPFGNKAAKALHRYDMLRERQAHADSEWFWITGRGRLQEAGLATMLARRGVRAGLGRVNPHRFRHTFAHEWKATCCGWAAGRPGRCWSATEHLPPTDGLDRRTGDLGSATVSECGGHV